MVYILFSKCSWFGKLLKRACPFGCLMRESESETLARCLKEQSDGVLINIEVKPGSKNTEIRGIDGWRKCIEITVRSRAERDSANRELIQFLSSLLSIPSNQITIVKGNRSRKKSIKVSGLTKQEVVLVLENEINKRRSNS